MAEQQFQEALARRQQVHTAFKESFSELGDGFSSSGEQALLAAEQEASGFNHGYIGIEHLLLGAWQQISVGTLNNIHGDYKSYDDIQNAIQFFILRRDGKMAEERKLTQQARNALAFAGDSAKRARRKVTAGDILRGVLHEGVTASPIGVERVALQVLEWLKYDLEILDGQLRALARE